jgi:hypothetical protein
MNLDILASYAHDNVFVHKIPRNLAMLHPPTPIALSFTITIVAFWQALSLSRITSQGILLALPIFPFPLFRSLISAHPTIPPFTKLWKGINFR